MGHFMSGDWRDNTTDLERVINILCSNFIRWRVGFQLDGIAAAVQLIGHMCLDNPELSISWKLQLRLWCICFEWAKGLKFPRLSFLHLSANCLNEYQSRKHKDKKEPQSFIYLFIAEKEPYRLLPIDLMPFGSYNKFTNVKKRNSFPCEVAHIYD